MRYAAVVSYDGTAFCGWQRQLGVASVQQSLEEALSKLCATSIPIVAAGRTDGGVHSEGKLFLSLYLPFGNQEDSSSPLISICLKLCV